MTDQQCIDTFNTHLVTEKRLAHNTVSAYHSDIAQLLEYLHDHRLSLKKATTQHLKKFVRGLHKRACKPRTIARKISAYKMLYLFLHDRYEWDNTAEPLVMPRVNKTLPNFLTRDEIEQLLAAARKDESMKGRRNLMMLQLLYATGMRITELVSLHVDQLRFDTGFILINGKGGKQREVPLPMLVCQMLSYYLKAIYPSLCDAIETKMPRKILFPTVRKGSAQPMTRQAFWLILKKLLVEANIPKNVSPHTLRHSLATHLLQAGADIRSLQLWLGHEKMSTVEMYTHLDKGEVRVTYDEKHPRA